MIKVMLYVSIGTVAMLFPMLIVAANRKTKLWKSLPVAFYATVTGTLSTYLWFLLENQWFGGISFFGAVFLVPLAFLLMRKPLREPYGNMMDMFAAGICMMLAVMTFCPAAASISIEGRMAVRWASLQSGVL